jgi:homoserine kinase type II
VPSVGGATVVEVDGELWSVQEWAAGNQTPRADVEPWQAAAMGRMLARIHDAFAGVPFDEGESVEVVAADPAGTLGRISELLAVIDGWPEPGVVERRARRFLAGLAEAHRAGRDAVAPPPLDARDVQLVHGDYHDGNVFFSGGEVSAVIDWERCRPWWPAMEVVRCLALSFDLEPARCRALVDAYGELRPATVEQLDAAAAVYGYERAHDLWLFRAIYLEGNDRARVFVSPKPYVPFADRWADLRRT